MGGRCQEKKKKNAVFENGSKDAKTHRELAKDKIREVEQKGEKKV